mgnify:CR=1 FL=1
MERYLKVETDVSLLRDTNTNAIVNTNRSEFDKFLKLSEAKYKEKKQFNDLKSDVDLMKNDLSEIKSLLKSIVHK